MHLPASTPPAVWCAPPHCCCLKACRCCCFAAQIASEALKGRVFEVSLADLQKVRRAGSRQRPHARSGGEAQQPRLGRSWTQPTMTAMHA